GREQQVIQNAPWFPVANCVAEIVAPLSGFHGSPILRLGGALNPRVLFLYGTEGPCHARGVMGDSEAALSIKQNDSTVAVEALLEIVHRFLRRPLRQASGFDAIRRPLREHQLHDGFAPSGSGSGGAEIIGVAAAADERRVAEAAGSFVERAAG